MRFRNFYSLSAATLFLLSGTALATLPPAPEPVHLVIKEDTPATTRALHACRTVAAAATARGALPLALLGDELSFGTAANALDYFVAASLDTTTSGTADSNQFEGLKRTSELFLAQKNAVMTVHQAILSIRRRVPQLQRTSQDVTSAELIDGAQPTRIAAASSLEMISQRLGTSAATLITLRGIDPEAVFLLKKDSQNALELLTGMIDGNPALRLRPVKSADLRQRLINLRRELAPVVDEVNMTLSKIRELVVASEGQATLISQLNAIEREASRPCFAEAGRRSVR